MWGGGRLLASDTENWVHRAALHRDEFTGRNQIGVEKEGR